jgi:hypothetical protein
MSLASRDDTNYAVRLYCESITTCRSPGKRRRRSSTNTQRPGSTARPPPSTRNKAPGVRPLLMRTLARFNRRVTTPTLRGLTGRIPGYANVVHTGRRTGQRYRTPVGITLRHNEIHIAVNYGRQSDWIQNVLSAKQLILEHRGRTLTLHYPEVVRINGRDILRAVLGDDCDNISMPRR